MSPTLPLVETERSASDWLDSSAPMAAAAGMLLALETVGKAMVRMGALWWKGTWCWC